MRDFAGEFFVDLLLWRAMISALLTIGIWWHVIQGYPGLLEAVGYLYGLLAASFAIEALEAYMESNIE